MNENDDIDTLQFYSTKTVIPKDCFEMFIKFVLLRGNIDHISNIKKARLNVCVYNKETTITNNDNTIIRITDIPNSNHKLVFKCSQELLVDMKEFYNIDIYDQWDMMTQEIFNKANE